MDLMTALAALGQAIGIVKDLRELDRSMDAADFKARLAEVTSTLADVRMALTDASAQLDDKDAEIARLIKDSARKAELVEYGGYSYDRSASGGPVGWPYCPVCMEDHLRLYRLVQAHGVRGGTCYCPKCNAEYRAACHRGRLA